MVIKASSRTQIDALITDLGSDRAIVRDAAITRLTVIGARALERILAVAGDQSAARIARVSAFRVLEAQSSRRALDVVLTAFDDAAPEVVAAAISAARTFLRGAQGAAVVDRLTTVALDRTRAESVRIAALQALSELEASTLKPLYDALLQDPNAAIAAHAAQPAQSIPPVTTAAWLTAIVEGAFPDDPAALRRAITAEGKHVPLAILSRLIQWLRERELAEPERRTDWMIVRGATHAALAAQRSLIALYDLREAVETATAPLPVEFLSALHQIGDASCLEAIAAAYPHATDEWWRSQLADLFSEIAIRERIAGRHAVMKRIAKRWPAILNEHSRKPRR